MDKNDRGRVAEGIIQSECWNVNDDDGEGTKLIYKWMKLFVVESLNK